jgi:hypothetical protein
MAAHMVAAVGRVDGKIQIITLAEMALPVPSESSGVLAVAIRRTPQTCN